MYKQEVFVFSPKGDLYALARGSSVLDFAFKVHSGLGSQCVGAKVNGKQVSIRHLVRNGDTVDIMTSSNQTPRREWLKFVKTSKAKNRIRSYLKRQQRERSIFAGKNMIEQVLKKYSARGSADAGRKEYQRKMSHLLTTFKLKDEMHLLSALGYGQLRLEDVMIEVFGSAAVKTRGRQNKRDMDELLLSDRSSAQQSSSDTSSKGIIVGRERNMMFNFCKNCNPLMGENIKGVVSKGSGIKIHRLGCEHLLEVDDDRVVNVQWDESLANLKPRAVTLHIICEDIPGILANASKAITSVGINIGNLSLRKLSNGRGRLSLEVMVTKLEDLEKVMTHLKMEEGIISVTRR